MKMKFKLNEVIMLVIILLLSVTANLPEQLASVVNVDPIIIVGTLVALVFISLLNHVFKLLPIEAVAKRTDSSQSRIAILEAVKAGNLSKLKHLLTMNVEVDFLQDGTSPAHIVAEQGNNELMQALINYGVNLNVINKDGLTPMEIAMAFGFKHTVEMLKASAEVDHKVA